MLTFLFFVLLFGIFGKLIWLAVKAAWGISKIVFSIVFLPVVVLVLFSADWFMWRWGCWWLLGLFL